MSTRLQVLLLEWVRRALRDPRFHRPVLERQSKLKAVCNAVGYSFPTAEIDQLLAEIERGYWS